MRPFRDKITAERLRAVLDYNPATGVFIWRVGLSRIAKAGTVAGSVHGRGYIIIAVDRVPYRAHRLAWLYVHGRWPARLIDHANGITSDNRIANLREATYSENLQNGKRRSTNKSGHTGVYWYAQTKRWKAQICIEGKRISLGYFLSLEEAAAAYVAAKARLHKFQPTERIAA